MSLWDNFKKKIERTSSGLDFWDKEENKRQRDFYAGVQPPAPQTGVLEVARPQAQPNISVDTRQPNFNVSVDTQPQPQPSLRLPSGQTMAEIEAAMSPEQRLERSVNSGLDSGKSWEDISRENNVPLENVRAYSQATRPNYGVAAPKYGSIFERWGDKLEANSPQDMYKRNEQGQAPVYDGTKFWQKGRDLAVGAGRELARIPETVVTSVDKSMDETAANDLDRALAEPDPVKRSAILSNIADPSGAWIQFGKTKMLDPNMSQEQIVALRDQLRGSQNAAVAYTEGAKRFLYGSEPVQTYQQRFRGMREEFKTDESAAQKYLTGQGEGGQEVSQFIARNAAPVAFTLAALGIGSDVIPDPTDLVKSPAKKGGKELIEDLTKTSLDDVGEALVKTEGKNKIAELLTKTSNDAEFSHITKAENLENILRTGKVNPSNLTDDALEAYEKLPATYLQKGTNNPYAFPDADNVNIVYKRGSLPKNAIEQGDELAVPGGISNEAIDYIEVPNAAVAKQVEDAGYRAVIKPELGVKPTEAVGAVKGKTQQIGELMDLSRFGKQTTENLDELLSKQYGIEPSTVRRLRSGYGDEATRNLLASTADATNIRDWNAFVISEARKRYGSPNVRIARPDPTVPKPSQMTPEELASLEKSAPPMAKIVEDLKVETPEVKPQVPDSSLGKMAETFYEAAAGNQRISFANLQKLGQTISRQIDDDFTAIGSDFSDVARRVQEGARNGIKSLDEVLSPEEAQILRKAQAEMNYIRRRASLGRKEVGEGNFGEMYLPQVKAGGRKTTLFDDFLETKPGSEFTRKNKIELEDLDYSPDVIGEYIVRYGDTKRYREQRIADTIAKNNPNVSEEVAQAAASKVVAIQDKVNSIKTKIGAFGFGSKKQLADGEFVDVADELRQVGKDLGHKQLDITDEGKGLTNGDRINSVMIGDMPMGNYLGLNQYRDAMAYSAQQVLEAGGDRMALARMVEQRLMRDYNISPDDLEYAVGGISRIAQDVPDEVLNARVMSTYRMAAKNQLMENLQNVNITNKKLRRDVSGLANQILREGSIEDELSAKVIKGVLKTQNAIFRKLNVSSAINELSDMTSFYSVYGKNLAVVPDFSAISRYGLGEIDAAIEPYIKQINEGVSLPKVLKKINNATNLYKFVEAYKAGVVANSVRKAYPDLAGDALTRKMLEDYRNLALPVDAFTKTFLDNTPLYTQYMTWGLRNLQKEGRLATGKIDAGVLADKSTMERIARNAYANLPAKTVFWLSSNGLKGTGILTAFGLTDFTGMTNSDYSGIEPEDKSWFDKTTQFTNTSTTLSMLNKLVQTYEKEKLKEKYADKDYNPYADDQWDQSILDQFKPSFYKNIQGAQEMMSKGYSENKGGRVQYEAPTDWWNTTKAYVFGKGQTENARDYSGRRNIQDRIADGENPFGAMIDMAKEQLSIKDTDYTRPLTEKYSEAYKKADENGRTDLLAGGRAYNAFLDDLKKDNPEAYNDYISSMDGNHVNPEYWKAIGGEGDLTTFNMMKNRKKQALKDLGTVYDPIYDLTDEQAKAVIQQKSAATGDDLALRNALYKEQWYKDYMAKVKDYYDQKPEGEEGEFDSTQRVKDWYAINDQYNALRTTATDTGERPDWAMQFPTVFAQKTINSQYGFDSEESKNFFRTYGDQYKNEKLAYDKANLDLINKMRAIEGYPPMSEAQYQQVTEIADTDGDSKKSSGYSRSGGSGGPAASFGDKGSFKLPTGAKINTGVKIARKKAYQPKAVKIQRSKKKA